MTIAKGTELSRNFHHFFAIQSISLKKMIAVQQNSFLNTKVAHQLPAIHEKHSPFCYLDCCDRKSRAACAQSFAAWQQATIEIMRRNLSYYCLLALHI